MRRARFSIISSVRRHTVAGLIVKDLFRGFEFWLVDEGLESSLPDEAVLATRLYTLEGFAMTAGVLVPLDIELSMRLPTRRNCSAKGKRRRSMTAVSQNLSIVLPLRAELWSGSPTKTRLPKPADVGVNDCSPEMWCV